MCIFLLGLAQTTVRSTKVVLLSCESSLFCSLTHTLRLKLSCSKKYWGLAGIQRILMSILNKITITGFKSILKQELELGQLNVFIGTNGAGKSNLLEAIAMLSASIEGGIDYDRLARRGARLSSYDVFRSAFKNKKRRKTFSMEAEIDDLLYKMEVYSVDKFHYHSESLIDSDGVKLCGRSNKGFKMMGNTVPSKPESEKSIIPIFRSFEGDHRALSKLEDFAIFAPSTPILRGISPDNSNKAPLGLYGGRLAEALKEILEEKDRAHDVQRFFQLIDWFKSVGFKSTANSSLVSEHVSLSRRIISYTDKYMTTNFNDLYAYDVSEGALYILFVLVLLSHSKSPDFFALDNVDNALNPGLVSNLIKHVSNILEEKPDKQILLTTHNPTTLDAIDLFNEKHRLFVVSRDPQDGQTIVDRISPPDGMTKEGWEEEYYGMKLSEIWLSGAIGGLAQGF